MREMKFMIADKFFQRLFPWSRLQLAPLFILTIKSLPSCPHPIRQNLISNIKYPDPYKRCFLTPYSESPWLLKIAFEIILGPKERERRHKGHDNHHQRKNRIQSSERHLGEDDREKQDQPLPSGRSQRNINHIKTERGGNDHEKDRSQRQREIRKEGRQKLVRSHVYTGRDQVDHL